MRSRVVLLRLRDWCLDTLIELRLCLDRLLLRTLRLILVCLDRLLLRTLRLILVWLSDSLSRSRIWSISRLVLRLTDCHLWLRISWSCLLRLRLVGLLRCVLRLLCVLMRRWILSGLLILAAAWLLRSSELLTRLAPRLLWRGLVVHRNLRDGIHS